MSSVAPHPSRILPRANTTATGISVASARPSVTDSAIGQSSGFPTRISHDPRNNHYLNSTVIEPTPPTETTSITIKPSQYSAEPASGPDPSAVPQYTDTELACIERWSQGPHDYQPLCTKAEKKRAKEDGDMLKLGASGLGALSILAMGAVGVYKAREMMRGGDLCGGSEAESDEEKGSLLPQHDKDA